MNVFSLLADTAVVTHLAYVLFVVLGLVCILLGYLRRWEWVRNIWFRVVHLSMIGIVVIESLLSITCPLTTLESYLRQRAGQKVDQGSFVARLVHELLFFDLPPQFFTAAYCAFGGLVLAALFLVPPRMRREKSVNPGTPSR